MNSLGEFLLDRTESLDEKLILDYFIERDDDKISRLMDSEQYLLEGSRGVGKTMLMKAAMMKSTNEFGKNSILPVWISFEESIRIERISIVDNSVDPFLQWTMGKILSETIKKLIEVKPTCLEELVDRIGKIFGSDVSIDLQKYSNLLDEYVSILEKGDVKNNRELMDKVPSNELISILNNPQSFKEFLRNLIKDFNLKRVVFLFDEAAHVFSYSQQEKFFTFFKSLRDPKIACKAAVYPGITNYGKYFDRGQDAKEIKLNWDISNSKDIKYIKDILKKRIQSFNELYWQKLTVNSEIIETICACSNGNPRFSFHIIDEIENNKGFSGNLSSQFIVNTIRSVFNTKWKEFDSLKKRLVKYSDYISEAENVMKEFFIPNIRRWNSKQKDNNRKLSIGFYISTASYDKLEKMFSVLDYSNIVKIDYSKKSLGHNKYGLYMQINPSLLFADLILKSISELGNVSVAIENNQAYYETTPFIRELCEKVSEAVEMNCSNSECDFKTVDEMFSYCPKCGSKIEQDEPESLYKILRSHSLKYLALSEKIVDRLSEKFSNIGELYDADESQIRMKYIQDVRVKKINNAVLEYMAG